MRYFISGHRDITQEQFNDTYVRKIKDILERDPDPWFVIGDYEGADIMAQEYLDSIMMGPRVTVYYMFEKPRNCVQGFRTIGGFQSDEERDSAMTRDSDFDIAFYKPEKGNSGTFQNVSRRWGILVVLLMMFLGISCESDLRQAYSVDVKYVDSIGSIVDTSFVVFPKDLLTPVVREDRNGIIRITYESLRAEGAVINNDGPVIEKGTLISGKTMKKSLEHSPKDSMYWANGYDIELRQ